MSAKTEKNSERPKHLFRPGESGNPSGKPRGTRHRITRLVEELLEGEAETLTRKMIELSINGDVQALRWVLDRLCPRLKTPPIRFDLPLIKTTQDAASAMSKIFEGLASGELYPDQASALTCVVTATIRAMEISDLEKRISAIELATEARKRT